MYYGGYGSAMNALGGLIAFLSLVQIGIIIGTVVLAVKKGYSGVLAFLLGLFIPLLGSLIIIALLPDKNSSVVSAINKGVVEQTKEEPIVEQLKEEIIGNDNDNTGKIKLIVERVNNVIYSAVPFSIFIDKKQAFSIENGSTRVIDFENNGPHSIYASLDYNTQSEVINFNTNNTDTLFKLSVLDVGKIKLERQG